MTRTSAALITFSHLRWNFVYQRPQHLLSRIAKQRPVYFIEEPEFDASAPAHWVRSTPEPNVTVLRPRTPVPNAPGFHEAQIPTLEKLLRDFLEVDEIGEHVAWFYTPMALPLLNQLNPLAVIYDCMDELSAFLHAPRELIEREARLFQLADVVFTGGPSLYRAKKDKHPNVHCFPSSVDTEHFSRGVADGPEAADQAHLPHPRFGYYGVIDERIDLGLLDALAVAHPEWQIVMVGPVVKIDPATLPRHPNLHYFGQKTYAELPSYLKGWDVCLLPFARNDSTKFISPTKTLEYMAGCKLMVSTAITDVVEPYGHFVYIGEDTVSFIECCEQAIAISEDDRRRRMNEGERVLAQTSWDRTASSIQQLIEQAVTRNRRAGAVRRTATVRTAADDLKSAPVAVIGAGPTGLSAAYHLGERALLIEKNSTVGGWCRSVEDRGFTFDFAGHIMFSADPYVHQLYNMLLGDNVHWQDREAWIYSKNVYTRYPFQGSLYGLPADVVTECIVGAIEARFGAVKPARPNSGNGHGTNGANGHGTNGHGAGHAAASVTNGHTVTANGTNGHAVAANGTNGVNAHAAAKVCEGDVKDCCGDGILESSAKLVKREAAPIQSAEEPKNFEEFIYKVWGRGIAKHFAIPYNRKLWAVPLSEMETSWLGGRVPMPDLEEMIEGALKPSPKPMGPNARFGYPLRGGFQALMNGFLPHLKGSTLLNASVRAVSPSKHLVTLTDGSQYRYSSLISTMPLPQLIRAMGNEAPAEIVDAVAMLRHVSVRCVNIGVGRENLTEKHWIYYPEDTVFHRIFVQGNASPHCNPPGGFGLTCEITYSEHKPLPCDGDALIERCIEDCHKVGFFKPEDPIWATNQVDMPYAYVVYDHNRKESVELIREWLAQHDIILAGRYSEWEYYNSDHAFIAGKKAADAVRAAEQKQEADRLLPKPLTMAAGATKSN